jgi:hypothetical protein
MPGKKEIKNTDDLHDRLEVLFLNLESGFVKPGEGKEMANVAGKIIANKLTQLKYQLGRKEKPEIPFYDAK